MCEKSLSLTFSLHTHIHTHFWLCLSISKRLPRWLSSEEFAYQCRSQGFDPLEEEMANHSSILAWEITSTEEPGRLQSMESQESDVTEVTKPSPHSFFVYDSSYPVVISVEIIQKFSTIFCCLEVEMG